MRAWAFSLSIGVLFLLAITLLSERFLPWPFSVGAPLFAQTLFLMGVLYALARRSRVFAQHASHAAATLHAAIAQMERARVRFLVVDLVLGATAITLGIGLLVLYGRTPLWSQLPAAALALGCALLAHAMTLGTRDSVHEYTRHLGVKASARLVGWRRLPYSRMGPTYEPLAAYELDLEVMPASGPSYTVTTTQYLRTHRSNMPKPGATIPVKYLTDRPEVVVVFLDAGDPPAW
jgi:hypothetical protein